RPLRPREPRRRRESKSDPPVRRRSDDEWADEVSDGEALGRNQLAAANDNTRTANPPQRISFAKIREPLEVPDLLGLQTDSFDWLIGSETWQDRVAAAIEIGDDSVATTSGLDDTVADIPPIDDVGGSMSLSFREHRVEAATSSLDECKERDMTYSAPLYVTAEFMNNNTVEIKSQTVFMGDFPLMTDKG